MNQTLSKSKHSCKFSAAKHIFLIILFLSLCGLVEAAVQVKSINTDYTNKRVTFSVSWASGTRNATHLSKVWLLVDYATITNPATTGSWQRATVVSATATSGTISGNNGKGFYLQGADGAFSSTVTVTLSGVPAKFNWCATATDYPPNAVLSNGTYTLKGTSPFIINGSITVAAKTYTGTCITSFSDATGCPGIVDQLPGGASIAVTSTACQNVHLSATGTNTTSWTWSNVNASSGAAATVTAVGTRTVYATPVNSCGNGTQVSRSVTVATCCSARDVYVGAGGCCQSGLTLVGGYCRDLAADNATNITCNSVEYEVQFTDIKTTTPTAGLCPSGWSIPSPAILKCFWTERSKLNLYTSSFDFYWSNTNTGYEHNCDYCMSPRHTALIVNSCSSCCCVAQPLQAGTLSLVKSGSNRTDDWGRLRCIR